MLRTPSLFVSVSISAMIVAGASPAFAQQAAGPAAQPAGVDTVQEIVVTAQRRAQNLLSVPLSISATTGEQLDKAGIRDLTSLQFTTPGYVPSDSSGYTQIFIRGIGNSIFVGADPSVATFIDDVPRIYGSMVENLVDVERVEVLKGAQGGLYGRNATGGVVNIITRQPSTDKFSGQGRVSYGQKNTLQAAVYENIPLGDKAAWSFAIERDQHDPYVRNIARANPYTASMFPQGSYLGSPAQTAAFFNSGVNVSKGLDNQDFWAVDSKLLLKPTDDFKITIAGDYSRKHDSNGNQIFAGVPGYLPLFATGLFESVGFVDPVTHAPTVNFPAGFFQGTNGKFTAERGIDAYTWLMDYGASVTAVWSLPKVDLTSITAYRAQQTDFFEDLAASPVPLVDVFVNNRKWFLYQELRAVSTDAGRFHYLAGATYLSNNFHGENHSEILAPLATTPVTHVDNPVRNWSVYGQLGYDITEALNLTVSGRYVHETNSAIFTTPITDEASLKETKFLPSATLSYKLDGQGNIYARWAKGFKAGGVNPIAPPSVFKDASGNLTAGSIFSPETVDTYEVGYRSALFGRRVQLTTAAFYNDYKNLQVAAHANAQHADISLAIVNAGSARTYGVEESLVWKASRAVTIGANAGYLNAKYKTFAVSNSTVLLPFDASGETMPNSPKWQLSFTGDLDQPINDRFRLVGDVLVSHLSSIIFLQSALPGVLPEPTQPGYWLTNLRFGVRTMDDRYGFAIFANNLFDEGYVTYGSSNALGNELTWGNPRIVGAEVSAKW